MINREQIYSALFARFQGLKIGDSPAFVTTSRRLRHWGDVPSEEQPALFQAQVRETASVDTRYPTKWALRVDLYLYTKADMDRSPSEIMNPLVDAVVQCLQHDHPVDGRCTLGGLVHHARVNGTIETDEGTLGDQAVSIIPVEILVND